MRDPFPPYPTKLIPTKPIPTNSDPARARRRSMICLLLAALPFASAEAARQPLNALRNGSFDQDLNGWNQSTIGLSASDSQSKWIAIDDETTTFARSPAATLTVLQQTVSFRENPNGPPPDLQITFDARLSAATATGASLCVYLTGGDLPSISQSLLSHCYSAPPAAWTSYELPTVTLPASYHSQPWQLNLVLRQRTKAPAAIDIDSVRLWPSMGGSRQCEMLQRPLSDIGIAARDAINAHPPTTGHPPFSRRSNCNLMRWDPWIPDTWMLDVLGVDTPPQPSRNAAHDFYAAVGNELAATQSTFVFSTLGLELDPIAELGGESMIAHFIAPKLAQLHDNIGSSNPKPWVRILFSKALGPDSSQAIWNELTQALDPDPSTWNFHLALTNVGEQGGLVTRSWNHSKVVVRDQRWAIVGGQNWEHAYLEGIAGEPQNYLYDLSMKVVGDAAADTYDFFDSMWTERGWSIDLFELACLASYVDPDDYYFLSEAGQACLDGPETIPPPLPPLDTGENRGSQIFAMGRGFRTRNPGINSTVHDQTADHAVIAAFDAAQQSIKISQHKLDLLLGEEEVFTVDSVIEALAQAAIRGVDVHIVISDRWGNASEFGGYPNSVAPLIHQKIDQLGGAQEAHCRVLNAPFRATGTDGQNFFTHHKFWMIDDAAFYIGSQNLYPSAIHADDSVVTIPHHNEYGFLVDDPDEAAVAKNDFWDIVWQESAAHRLWGYAGCSEQVCPLESVPDDHWQATFFNGDVGIFDWLLEHQQAMVRDAGDGFLDFTGPDRQSIENCGLAAGDYSAFFERSIQAPTADPDYLHLQIRVNGPYELYIEALNSVPYLIGSSSDGGFHEERYTVEVYDADQRIYLKSRAPHKSRLQLIWRWDNDPWPNDIVEAVYGYRSAQALFNALTHLNDAGSALAKITYDFPGDPNPGGVWATGRIVRFEEGASDLVLNGSFHASSNSINEAGTALFELTSLPPSTGDPGRLISWPAPGFDDAWTILPGNDLEFSQTAALSDSVPRVVAGTMRTEAGSRLAFVKVLDSADHIETVSTTDLVHPPEPQYVVSTLKYIHGDGRLAAGYLQTADQRLAAIFDRTTGTWTVLPSSALPSYITLSVDNYDHPWVVGKLVEPGFRTSSWLWNIDTHEVKTLAPEALACQNSLRITGVNSRGNAVGLCSTTDDTLAFRWSGMLGDPPVDLNLLDPHPDWHYQFALDINNFGDIIGGGTFEGDPTSFKMTMRPAGSPPLANPPILDVAGWTANETLTLENSPPPSDAFESGWQRTVEFGSDASLPLAAFGQLPLSFGLADDDDLLLDIDPETGVLTWAFASPSGQFRPIVEVTDAAGDRARQELTLTVVDPSPEGCSPGLDEPVVAARYMGCAALYWETPGVRTISCLQEDQWGETHYHCNAGELREQHLVLTSNVDLYDGLDVRAYSVDPSLGTVCSSWTHIDHPTAMGQFPHTTTEIEVSTGNHQATLDFETVLDPDDGSCMPGIFSVAYFRAEQDLRYGVAFEQNPGGTICDSDPCRRCHTVVFENLEPATEYFFQVNRSHCGGAGTAHGELSFVTGSD